MPCRISIITITLNSDTHLEQTITSVCRQSYDNREHIIIDGGSTDCSVEIIKKYEDKISYWVSEPDNGISHAMNKGLCHASGDYILFLHADDYLHDNFALESAVRHMKKAAPIYIFPVLLNYDGAWKKSKNRSLGWWTNFKMASCHQGQFCARELFSKLGGFDEQLKICMDYDFLLRAYRAGIKAKIINEFPPTVMRQTGISSRQNWQDIQKRLKEECIIHKKHCPTFGMSLTYQAYWKLYMTYRKIRSLFP